jgi:hypothetical protein
MIRTMRSSIGLTAAQPTTEVGPASVSVPLGPDRSLEVMPSPEGASLRVRSTVPGEVLELELRFEAGATTLRLRASAVEIQSPGRIVAECDDFCVNARRAIELRSAGVIHQLSAGEHRIEAEALTVDASPGAVRLRANDDVQLLGEQVLLNCDRTPPMPSWVPPGRDQLAALPPAPTSGDADVLAEMVRVED